MHRLTTHAPLLLVALALALPPIQAAGQATDFGPLLKRLPPGANAIVLLNADEIFASEVAQKEGWRHQYERNYAKAPLRMPPEARQFALAAELDLGSLTPRWESAVMRTGADIPISTVQRIVKGRPDQFGDLQAAVAPNGAYIVRFAPQEYGILKADDRQSVARWIAGAEQGGGDPLSPYLASAATYSDRAGTEIIMALDLSYALGYDSVSTALAASPVLTESGADKQAATDVVCSLQGVTLGVRVSDKPYGSLKVDFAKPIEPIASVAKPLLLEALAQAGASIDEFEEWKVQTTDKGFRISGVFTESGLTRVFSFLELDSSAVDGSAVDGSEPGAGQTAGPDGGDPADRYKVDVPKTKEYYDAVDKYLNDLSRETGAKSYYSIATWFEKYAKRIDRLPILGVDSDLVDYGAYTVSQLYDCAEAIRGAGIRTGSRGATVSGSAGYQGSGYGGGYSNYGYSNRLFAGSIYDSEVAGVRAAEAERIAIRKQERAASSTTVRGLMRELKEKTSAIRRGLTERYQVEF